MSVSLARDLEVLAQQFKAAGWHELRVEYEGLSLLFSNDAASPALDASPHPSVARAQPVEGLSLPDQREGGPADLAREAASGNVDPAWMAVTAPTLGTFYRSPKPGAAPFVEIGTSVSADAEVCLLEVMKLFTSVKAGVAGVVRRICAGDADLVEGGQVLFYIEPQEA